MAKKKSTAQAAAVATGLASVIVAFMKRDHFQGEGDDQVIFTLGQRLELPEDEFIAMEEAGLCERGVYVRMLQGVEGGKYSLRPGDATWLPRHAYEAWKVAEVCEMHSDDPDVTASMAARIADAEAAITERDAAMKKVETAEANLQEMGLEFSVVSAQVVTFAKKVSELVDLEDDANADLKSELASLVATLPVEPGAGTAAEPETLV